VPAPPPRSFGSVRAGFVTMAGGVVMILGTVLPFQRIATNIPGVPAESFSALDLSEGPLYLGLGGTVAAFGLVILLGRGALPRALGALAILGGAIALVAGVIDVMGTGEEGLRILADAVAHSTRRVSAEQVLTILRQRDVSVTPGIGLFVILAGSLVAVMGGVWAAVTRTPVAVAPPAPPPPAPGEGEGELREDRPGD
jgi:hypothetical protein